MLSGEISPLVFMDLCSLPNNYMHCGRTMRMSKWQTAQVTKMKKMKWNLKEKKKKKKKSHPMNRTTILKPKVKNEGRIGVFKNSQATGELQYIATINKLVAPKGKGKAFIPKKVRRH